MKIFAEATLVFPILVAETFAKRHAEATKVEKVEEKKVEEKKKVVEKKVE